MRARATPTNPNTEAQQAVRDAMRNAVYAWANVLSATQRENWNTYAFNTPTFNRLGEATHKTGQQMFIRGYIPRAQGLMTLPTDAPTVFDLGDFTAPGSIIADESLQSVALAFTDTDAWANTDNASLFIYVGRPQNATRNYGKGPYQLSARIDGSSTSTPSSPYNFTPPFPFVAGQRLFFKFNVSMPDGRWSSATLLNTIAVA